MGEEGDHIVAGDLLDLVDPSRVGQSLAVLFRGLPQSRDRVGGYRAQLRHGLRGRELDLQPDRELLLGREEPRHLRAGVAWDHSSIVLCRRAGGF
jgi:hypothetical protein